MNINTRETDKLVRSLPGIKPARQERIGKAKPGARTITHVHRNEHRNENILWYGGHRSIRLFYIKRNTGGDRRVTNMGKKRDKRNVTEIRRRN